MRSRRPFCRGSIPPGHCQPEAAAEAAPMAGWRAHAILERFPGDSAEGSGGFLLAFHGGFVGVPPGAHRDSVGILRRFCGGFCWNQQKVLGASARPAQAPHASTQRRRRIATIQACSKSPSKDLRAARAATWAAHHPLSHDSLAEWSKALASGASPKGRGFEPHRCQKQQLFNNNGKPKSNTSKF